MDKIEKALAKFTKKEREEIHAMLARLLARDEKGLDIKKLKGRHDVFRVRKRNIRAIYRIEGGKLFLLAIERRNEKTYKDL